MMPITQVDVMHAPILLHRQIIGLQKRWVYWWWSQQVRFMRRVFIREEPEVIAFPSRRWLDVLQIDLQLIRDTLRTVSYLSAADIESVSDNRTRWERRTRAMAQEQEVGAQRAAQ